MIHLYIKVVSDSLGRIPGCTYTICSYGQISQSCTITSGSLSPPIRVRFYTLLAEICCIRFLCDWSFCLYHHIIFTCYFDASCLYLFQCNLYLRCYILLIIIINVSSSSSSSNSSRSSSSSSIYSVSVFPSAFHWSLSDSKSPQVSRTLLCILADLSNVLVWIVSTHSVSSKSISLFKNPSVAVPRAPHIIIIIIYSFRVSHISVG